MDRSTKVVTTTLLALFYFPVWILLLQLKPFDPLVKIDFLSVLTAILGSALIGVFLIVTSFVSALGLSSVNKGKIRTWLPIIEKASLVPLFLPTILTIILCMNAINPFPFGAWGVTAIFFVTYWGLFSFQFLRSFSTFAEEESIFRIWSDSKFLFIRKVYFPSMRNQIFSWWIYATGLVLTSLSVPLIAGGGRFDSLELLLVDRLRRGPDWNGALFYAGCEMLFVLLAYKLIHSWSDERKKVSVEGAGSFLLSHCSGYVFLFSWLAIVIVGLFRLMIGAKNGLVPSLMILEPLIWGTVLQGILSGMAMLTLLVLCLYVSLRIRSFDWLQFLILPSIAILSSSLIGFFSSSIWTIFFKVALLMAYVSMPSILRLSLLDDLALMKEQFEVARQMGAGPFLVLRKVVTPQLAKPMAFSVALFSAWGAGDFAVSGLLTGKQINLGLAIENSLQRYQSEKAAFLALVLVVISIGLFFVFNFFVNQFLSSGVKSNGSR